MNQIESEYSDLERDNAHHVLYISQLFDHLDNVNLTFGTFWPDPYSISNDECDIDYMINQ